MINAPVSKRDWESHPPLIHPPYTSTVLRGPTKPLVPLAHGLAESTGPVYGHESVQALDGRLRSRLTQARHAALAAMPALDAYVAYGVGVIA